MSRLKLCGMEAVRSSRWMKYTTYYVIVTALAHCF